MEVQRAIDRMMYLACGLALPAAAGTLAYASGLDQGSSAMIGVTAAGLVSAAGGIWGNLYADAHQRLKSEAEAERGRIFNHDLARAVAQSIATLLQPLAKDERFSEESRSALAALCNQSERLWVTMVNEDKTVFAPLLEEDLAEAVMVNPMNPQLGSYGTRNMWSQVIEAMAIEAGGEVSANLKNKTPAFAEAARVCHEGFSQRFFNDLKHDFANKGQAFAAVHLRMMGELVTLARAQHDSKKLVHDKLDALTAAVKLRCEEVIAWVGDGEGDLTKGRRRLTRLRPLTKWLKSIDQKLASIDHKADEILLRLKKIEKQGVRTEQAVREGTNTTGKRVANAHTKTRRLLCLTIVGGILLVVVAVLVTCMVNSKQAKELRAEEEAKANARMAPLQDNIRQLDEQLTAILDTNRKLWTIVLRVDGEETNVKPSFTSDDRTVADKASGSNDPLTRAMVAIIKGDTEQARDELAKMQDPAPIAVDYYTTLGDSFYFEERFDDAAEQYAKVVALLEPNPTPKSLHNLANSLLLSSVDYPTESTEQAIGLFTRIIDLPADSTAWIASALINRGLANWQHGHVDEAIADFSRIIDLPAAPTEWVASALINRGTMQGMEGRPDDAIADFTHAIDLPSAPAELSTYALYNRGMTYGRQGHPDEAIADYTRLIDLPSAPAKWVALAFINRGGTYGLEGNLDEAFADFTHVIDLPAAQPKEVASALFNRGIIHAQLGHPGEAIADYTRTIDLPGAQTESVAKALINRGGTHLQLGHPDEAIADYSRTIDLPAAPAEWVANALVNRAILYGQQGRVDEELADYTRVVDLPAAPAVEVAGALLNRGLTNLRLGQFNEAITDFTRVIDLPAAPARKVASALLNRGNTYRRQGRLDEAIMDFTSAIDMPADPVELIDLAFLSRGGTHALLGHLEEAIADFTHVIDLSVGPAKNVVLAYNGRGSTYGLHGYLDEAIADYTRIIDMHDAPAKWVAEALFYRRIAHEQLGLPDEAIADYTHIINLPGAPVEMVANALYYRGDLRKQAASTRAAACTDFAQAARLFASIRMIESKTRAEQEHEILGCDD